MKLVMGPLGIMLLILVSATTVTSTVHAAPPAITSVTVTAPANNTSVVGTYVSIAVTVVTNPATIEKDALVSVFVNSTSPVCPATNASISGLFSCGYQVTAAGRYEVNVTATANLPSGPVTKLSANYYFTAGQLVQAIPLVAGWNLISIPLVPASTAIGTVLASQVASKDVTIVWSYQSGIWYSAFLSSGLLVGSLTTMKDGFGYWVYMTKADTLYAMGYVIQPASSPPAYSLSIGWNLIGFKPQPTVGQETVGAYLTSLSTKYDPNNVWIYDNPTGTWSRANSATNINPGQALWIYLSGAAILYP